MHMISYKPVPGSRPDYHICYQCGFIIRLFENPPDKRFDFRPSDTASSEMERLLADPSIPAPARAAKDMLVNGILTQLRSIPIGLRIDDLLWSACPDLRGDQIASANLQLRQNTATLAPHIRKSFPQQIVNGNTAMNAAFAAFWSEKLSDASITLPYRSIGAQQSGMDLLQVYATLGSEAARDWELVDSWARILGFSGWYDWVPYRLDAVNA